MNASRYVICHFAGLERVLIICGSKRQQKLLARIIKRVLFLILCIKLLYDLRVINVIVKSSYN